MAAAHRPSGRKAKRLPWRDYLQRAISAILRCGQLRFVARQLARTAHVPWSILERVPVEGTFEVNLQGRQFIYESSLYDAVGRRLFWTRSQDYEADTFRALARLLRPGAFLDVGANTGIFSLFAAQFEGVVCHAFEPSPEVFSVLQRNAVTNGMQDRIVCQRMAVGASTGSVRLHIPDRNWSSATLDEQGFRGATGHVQQVECTTLDDYVRQRNLRDVIAIKVDVEGFEHVVVQGSRNLLERDRPAVICECLEESQPAELTRIFRELGYAWFQIGPNGAIRCETFAADAAGEPVNYLFLPTDGRDR